MLEVDFGAEGVEPDGAEERGAGVVGYGDVGFFGEAVGGVVDVVGRDGVVDVGGDGGEGSGIAGCLVVEEGVRWCVRGGVGVERPAFDDGDWVARAGRVLVV